MLHFDNSYLVGTCLRILHCRGSKKTISYKVNKPPLYPIPVSHPFQIVGVDIMDLPVTKAGNRHVVVFQDFLTKFPLVCPVLDQKAIRLAKLLVEHVIPLFGVPESLLSDRGTNLLSYLMCTMLGIRNINTTYRLSSTMRWHGGEI